MPGHAKNAEQITIYHNPDRFEAHTCPVQLANGDVVVTFCETRAKTHEDFDSVYLVRSTDNGKTFDPATRTPVWVQTTHFGSDIPLITQLSDGTLLMNHLVTSFHGRKAIAEDMGWQSDIGVMRAKGAEGTWISRSTDNGHTWEPGYKVNSEPLRWTMPADSILELPNGTLLMAVLGQLNTRRERKDAEPIRSVLLRSDNGGMDWEHWSTIAFDPAGIISFDEPALGRTADGVLVCMMRTEHLPRGRHQHMWVAYSYNDGESWTRPEATNIWGYPADLTLLSDGRMLATYGYRRGVYGVRGVISPDGLSWDVKDEFIIREGPIPPIEATIDFYHIGYPHSIQLNDGTIFSVDHAFTPEPYVQYVVGVRWEA
jgi:sialidase-1